MRVVIENANSKIWNIEIKVVEIIYSLINDGEVTIDLNTEGPCCEDIGLYTILDLICEKFEFLKSNITIETSNFIEKNDNYIIEKNKCINIYNGKLNTLKQGIIFREKAFQKDNFKLFGSFVGRASWVRIWLCSLMWKKYPDKIIGTFHWDIASDSHLTHIELNEMIRFGASFKNINDASNFLNDAPYELHKVSTFPIQWTQYSDIIEYYDKFFVDVVCETYFSGNTFSPTEKTWRPIATKTPFIIHASTDFLKNLRKLGFKTFDKWWSEEYDDYGHEARIEKIIEITDYLANLTPDKIQDMYNEMHDVLEHNYRTFHNLTEETFRRTFIEQ